MPDVELGTATAKIELGLNSLNRDMGTVRTALRAIEKALDSTEKTAKDSGKEIENVFKRIGASAKFNLMQVAVQAFRPVTDGLIALGKASIDAFARMDSLKRGLTAIAGSAEEAERQLVRLEEIAKLPGISFEGAIEGSIRLQAAGISAKQAEASLRAFSNALASVGKGSEELHGVTLALSQIQSKGKVLAEEINQIAERVPQVRNVMIKVFGTADTEILQKARITSREFIEIITDELAKANPVIGGLKNTIENAQQAITKSFARIGEALAPIVAGILSGLVPALESMTKWFRELPEWGQKTYLVLATLAAASGPVAMLAVQFIALGEAIGAATFAIAGPVGLAAVVAGLAGLGIAGLINAESDRKTIEAEKTAIQTLSDEIDNLAKKRTKILGATTVRDGKPTNSRIAADIAALDLESANKDRRLRSLLMAQTRRDAEAASKEEQSAYEESARKQAQAQDARRRVTEANNAKARAEAERAARKAEAEAAKARAKADRLRDMDEGLQDETNRLNMPEFAYRQWKAQQDRIKAMRGGGTPKRAGERFDAQIGDINRDAGQVVAKDFQKASEIIRRVHAQVTASIDSLTEKSTKERKEIEANLLAHSIETGKINLKEAIFILGMKMSVQKRGSDEWMKLETQRQAFQKAFDREEAARRDKQGKSITDAAQAILDKQEQAERSKNDQMKGIRQQRTAEQQAEIAKQSEAMKQSAGILEGAFSSLFNTGKIENFFSVMVSSFRNAIAQIVAQMAAAKTVGFLGSMFGGKLFGGGGIGVDSFSAAESAGGAVSDAASGAWGSVGSWASRSYHPRGASMDVPASSRAADGMALTVNLHGATFTNGYDVEKFSEDLAFHTKSRMRVTQGSK